jgi:hypothetical protein
MICRWRRVNARRFSSTRQQSLSPAPDLLVVVLQDWNRRCARPNTRIRRKPFRERDQAEPLRGILDPEEGQHQPQTFLIGCAFQFLHGEHSRVQVCVASQIWQTCAPNLRRSDRAVKIKTRHRGGYFGVHILDEGVAGTRARGRLLHAPTCAPEHIFGRTMLGSGNDPCGVGARSGK